MNEEPRIITVMRTYIPDVEDRELYIIATNAIAEQIKGLKMQIGTTCSIARLRLNMDNLKGSNEALGEARKMTAQYTFLKNEWEKVRPQDAEDPDKEELAFDADPPSLTEAQMEALQNGNQASQDIPAKTG